MYNRLKIWFIRKACRKHLCGGYHFYSLHITYHRLYDPRLAPSKVLVCRCKSFHPFNPQFSKVMDIQNRDSTLPPAWKKFSSWLCDSYGILFLDLHNIVLRIHIFIRFWTVDFYRPTRCIMQYLFATKLIKHNFQLLAGVALNCTLCWNIK